MLVRNADCLNSWANIHFGNHENGKIIKVKGGKIFVFSQWLLSELKV